MSTESPTLIPSATMTPLQLKGTIFYSSMWWIYAVDPQEKDFKIVRTTTIENPSERYLFLSLAANSQMYFAVDSRNQGIENIFSQNISGTGLEQVTFSSTELNINAMVVSRDGSNVAYEIG